MDPCFVTPVGANWQVWAIAIFQPANADDHQVTTGIMLATRWVTLNGTTYRAGQKQPGGPFRQLTLQAFDIII
jgi:hypothetical protein